MQYRNSDHPITPLLLNRWSPRAMNGEPLAEEELLSVFEAARWAPSAFNEQPWHFIYAKRDTVHWNRLFQLLVEFNQSWVKNAAVVGVILSRKTFAKNNKPSPSHAFDAGAAWENLCLEGFIRHLVVHGMAGFDYDRAKKELNVPDNYEVLAMFAVGKPAPKETLPPALQEKENPSSRKKISEFISEGLFKIGETTI